MKIRALLLLCVSPFLFTHCTRDMPVDYSSTTKEIISQGSWSVDYYFAGSDRTAQYTNYTFSFHGNGTLTGRSGSRSFNGTWTTVRDVNRNDVLQISFNGQEPQLSNLSEQWNVTAKNTALLSMQDRNSAALRFRKM